MLEQDADRFGRFTFDGVPAGPVRISVTRLTAPPSPRTGCCSSRFPPRDLGVSVRRNAETLDTQSVASALRVGERPGRP